MLTFAILLYSYKMSKIGRVVDVGFLPFMALILDCVIMVNLCDAMKGCV